MANTYVDYTATAAQQYFAFNFPYLEDEHVVVEIEGVDQTITTNYTIETSPTQRINLSNPTTALAGGELVRIKRRSAPNTNLVDFQNGSVLTESELDRAYLHNRYLAEEATEGADSGLKELEGSTNYNAGNKQIKNLADGTLATDAVNKQYVDTQIALTDTNLAGFYKSIHTGNAVDNVFTLSFTPQTTDAKAYIVSIDGLVQVPDTDYTIGATAITFNTIPANSAEICVVATAAASVATVNEAQVTATGSTTARSLADRFADVVNVLDFIPPSEHAAIKDGTTTYDAKDDIQAAINSGGGRVILPAGCVFIISDAIELPSNFTLEINGDLLLAPNTPDDTTMITNSDRVNRQNNIHVIGSGRVLGNKANQQTGVEIRHTCIDFLKVSGCTISVAEVGSNKWDNAYDDIPASGKACAIQVHDCRFCRVSGVLLYEWEHEGINLDPAGGDCYGNIVENCTCEGSGAKSYSGIQMGGEDLTSYSNIISSCIVRNCGASGIGLDSRYSVVTGCTVWRNGYAHGINLGHKDAVADYSVISNCSLFDIGNFATRPLGDPRSSHGINIGNGTKNITITNCNIKTVYDSAFHLSTGESCVISNCRIEDTGAHAFRLNVATGTKISNIVAENIGGSLVNEVGSPNDDLWYEINETVFKRYGSVPHQGTFTPIIVGSTVSGNHTYSIQSGFYERNDRLVTFRGRLVLTSKGTLSGNLKITGLPFIPASVANSYGDIDINIARNLNITAGQSVTGYIALGVDEINLELWDDVTGSTAMTDAELTDTSQLFFSGVYQV